MADILDSGCGHLHHCFVVLGWEPREPARPRASTHGRRRSAARQGGGRAHLHLHKQKRSCILFDGGQINGQLRLTMSSHRHCGPSSWQPFRAQSTSNGAFERMARSSSSPQSTFTVCQRSQVVAWLARVGWSLALINNLHRPGGDAPRRADWRDRGWTVLTAVLETYSANRPPFLDQSAGHRL